MTITPERAAQITEAIGIAGSVASIAGLAFPGASSGIALGTAIASKAIPFFVEQYDAIMAAKPAEVTRDEWIAYLTRVEAMPDVFAALDAKLNPPENKA